MMFESSLKERERVRKLNSISDFELHTLPLILSLSLFARVNSQNLHGCPDLGIINLISLQDTCRHYSRFYGDSWPSSFPRNFFRIEIFDEARKINIFKSTSSETSLGVSQVKESLSSSHSYV